MKHTEGPWDYIDMARDESTNISLLQDDRFVVRCKTSLPGISGVVARCGYRYNAELIAAAPDMLDALRAVGINEVSHLVWDRITRAIKKATGRGE